MKKWIVILKKRRFSKKGFVIAALPASCLLLIIVSIVNHVREKRQSQEIIQRLRPVTEKVKSNTKAVQANTELINKILENQQSIKRQERERLKAKEDK